MDKKKGIIIAIVLLLLLSVGTFAFTRNGDIEKLDGDGVTDNGGSSHDKDQDNAIEPSDDSTGEDDNTWTAPVLGQVGGNGQTNEVQANPPVFTLDDVKVDRVEFASSFTMPDVQVQDEDGTMLTAVITYEYRATESDEFEAADSFDTTRIGQYRITYTVTNSRGLSSSQSFIVTISDTTAPVVGGVPSGATNENVTLEVDEAGDYTVTVNGEKYDGDLTFTDSRKYEVTVEDASGNSVTVNFTIDQDAPVVTLYKGEEIVAPELWYNKTLKAQIEDLTTYTATLNKVAYTSEEEIIANPNDAKWYTLVVTDEAGNETTVTFGIDTIAPTFNLSGAPMNWTGTKVERNSEFSCPTAEEMTKFATDANSGVKSVVIQEARSKVDTFKVGTYGCYYTVTDNAGNSVTRSMSYEVVDTIAPEITRIKLQTQHKNTNYANITDKLMITVETNEDLLSNPELQINGITPKFGSVNKETFPKDAEHPTVYKYTFYEVELSEEMKLEEDKTIAVAVKVTDLAGISSELTSTGINNGNPEKEVIYDNAKPVIAKVQIYNKNYFDSGYIKNGETLVVDATLSEELVTLPTLTVGSYTATMNKVSGGNGEIIYQARITIDANEAVLVEGPLSFTISGYTDKAGNTNVIVDQTQATKPLIYDRTAPMFDLGGAPMNWTGTKVERNSEFSCPTAEVMMTFATDEHSGVKSVELQEERSKVDTSKVGLYECAYTVIDNAGNSVTRSMSYEVEDTKAPEVTVWYSPDTPTNHGVYAYIEANEPIQELGGNWAKKSDTLYRKAYPKNWEETVIIKDLYGNETSVEIKVTNIDKTAPTIRLLGSSNVTIDWGSEYTDEFGIEYSDNYSSKENMTVQVWYTFKAVGTTTYTEVDAIDTKKAGQYYQYYTVTDEAGNVSERVSRGILVVDEIKPDLHKIVASDIYYKVGDKRPEISELVEAIDNNDGNITDKVYILHPDWLNMNEPGVYLVEFYVYDASGNRAYTPLRIHVEA